MVGTNAARIVAGLGTDVTVIALSERDIGKCCD